MTGEHTIPLDRWIEIKSASDMEPGAKAFLPRFFLSWKASHSANPLLFPLKNPAAFWQDQFDWFMNLHHPITPSPESSPPVSADCDPGQ